MSDELLSIFWVEVGEHLETLNNQLLQVEMIAADDQAAFKAAVREMNRVAHSMKGAARAVGITIIETVSHYMEEVFSAAMNGKLTLTPEIADSLYDGLDLIQNIADGIETDEDALAAVLANLEQIVVTTAAPDLKSDSQEFEPLSMGKDSNSGQTVQMTYGDMVEAARLAQPGPEGTPTDTIEVDERGMPAPKSAVGLPRAAPIPETTIPPQPTPPKAIIPDMDGSTMVIRPVEETVRVTVSKLDRLMAEVTELFVARMHGEEQQRSLRELRQMHVRWQREWRSVRAAYIRLVRRLQDREEEMGTELPILFRFLETNQRYLTEANRHLTQLWHALLQDNMRLATLSDQLQDDIGGMRLMPFESIVGGFQRMIRDLSRDMGKQINLEILGATVDIDKAVLDALKDPIMHLLRNAIDHGIELPDVRQRGGKSPVGRITLDVQQRGSEIVINVIDDGQGIDANKVRRAIVKNQLLNEAEAAALNDDDTRMYIFHPGLSTSDKVTALSGRGMGMDIVRDRVESLRGRVSVQSKVGQGTAVTLNVPVSLTRIRCIMLRLGEQQFAVPSAMVMRMDKIPRGSIFTTEGRDTLMVNERPLPLVSMGSILDVPSSAVDEEKLSYVALQATDRAVAFEVDELYSEQELVLKPLGPELARARFVSGASLLGTGEVIIVLDANDLVRRATGAAMPRRRAAITALTTTERRLRVLVIDDSITTRTLEKNILETAGFDVYVAIDGMEAWSMLPTVDPDVIISDVEMPNMNGLELTARIKSSTQFQHIPVVLLTSLGKPEQREAGLRAGANAYLVKSRFDQGELLQTIQAVV